MQAADFTPLLRPFFEGRKWILAGGPVAGYPAITKQLRELGAERSLIVAEQVGTGPLPDKDHADWVSYDVRATSMMDGFRQGAALLEDPPDLGRAAIDRYDPDGTALVLGNAFIHVPAVHGRRVYGWRRTAWWELEDKVVVDEFWDAAGIPHAPSQVVAVEAEAIRDAAKRLGRGDGVVVQADVTEGFNGGAEYLRWLKEPFAGEPFDDAVSFLAGHSESVRVAPFLEGIPVSVHGCVLPEAVIVFRPVENLILRRPGETKLQYAATATFYDPPDADREIMREHARKAGELLRERVDYRGFYTCDGILTAEGWRAVELNTRAGGGVGNIKKSIPELPLDLLQQVIMDGDWERMDLPERAAAELERVIVEGADAVRNGGGHAVVTLRADETVEHKIVEDGVGGYRLALESETPDGKLMLGPANTGALLRFFADSERTPAGPSIAPRTIAAFALADQIFGTNIGPLEPAKPVR